MINASAIDLQTAIPLVTGSGGALVVFWLWVTDLKKRNVDLAVKNDVLIDDLKSISKDAIECITKVIEKEEVAGSWRDDVMEEIRRIGYKIDQINK
jgi:hypothetical protein